MNIADVLGLLTLVVGVPLNLLVTTMLWQKASEAPHIKVLRERLVASASVLLVVIVFGLIFVNNDMETPLISGDATRYITRIALLVIAVIPAMYWLWLYRGDRR